jgi:GT2 family glycosyltransferase
MSIKKYTSIPYRIYLADTGSSSEELTKTEDFLKQNFQENTYKLIYYSYYNYAKINNDVVNNHLHDDIDLLLFCNNDIECVNDIIDQINLAYNSLRQRSFDIGTLGCRLIYPNGKIQHDGQIVIDNGQVFGMTHINLNKESTDIQTSDFTKVVGNTFAFCLTERLLFLKNKMLNEEYKCCFEDVEYNLRCIKDKRINFLLPTKYYAIHHESYTRKDTEYHFHKDDYLLIKKYIIEEFKK